MSRWSSLAGLLLPALLLAGCEARDELVVYCALDQEHSEKLLQGFTEKTGIPLRPVFDNELTKTVGLRGKIQQEKNRPRCDVFWNNEILNTLILKRDGCLEPYRSRSAKDIPDQFKDPEGYWTGFAARARIFIVNSELCPEDQSPRSYRDYLDTERRGQWCIAKPVAGTTATHVAVLFDLLGVDKTKEWMMGLRQNDGAIYTGNGHVMRQVRDGTRHYGFTDTDDFRVAEVDQYPVYKIYPDQGEDDLGCLVIPNVVSLIKNAPHPEYAKKFIDYVLSPEVEEILAHSRSAQIPVRADVPCPPHVKRISELKVMPADFEKAADHWEESQAWVRDVFLGSGDS